MSESNYEVHPIEDKQITNIGELIIYETESNDYVSFSPIYSISETRESVNQALKAAKSSIKEHKEQFKNNHKTNMEEYYPTKNKEMNEIDGFIIYKSESGVYIAMHPDYPISVEGDTKDNVIKSVKEVWNIYKENSWVTDYE
jgi:predicted RNase H-like HicB family nuclease